MSHSVRLFMAAGEQISQVSGIHVEPTVMGHGGCSYHGHRTGQWRGKKYYLKIELSLLLSLIFSDGYIRCHQGKPPDWQDFVGIITLLLINSTISFIEENNAGNAAAALMARLAPKAKVLNYSLICDISLYFPCIFFAVPI